MCLKVVRKDNMIESQKTVVLEATVKYYPKKNPTEDAPKAILFASPNTRECLNVEQATKQLTGDEHARMAKIYADRANQLGLTAFSYNAIGDWSDGAENTIYSEVSNARSYEDVERLAAVCGMASQQKAVIPFFVEADGADAVYKIRVPRGNGAGVRKSLDEVGLQYRTFVTCFDSIQVVIFDKGSILKDSVSKFASIYGTQPEEYRGRGDFLGGNTRVEGKAAYQKVLKRIN